jgi:DNA/RNA-binding domain of Phe-tRNA-synthetase-like protein
VRRDLVPGLLGAARIAVLLGIDVAVRALDLIDLDVTEPRADFDAVVADVEADAREGRIWDVGPARALYRRFGVDPRRYRPSSEALLRRVRRGEPLPRVNSLVDAGNVVSLRLQVPVGIYDLDQAEGPLTVRLGREGESYAGIGKDAVSVAGRICLADERGPCGNPSADSARTMITTATRRAAWIFFLPVSTEDIDATAELVARHGRGLARLA